MTTRYILHLSDLHFGTLNDAILWSNQLVEDIFNELKCPHINALIISGDITNRSIEQEYTTAKHFIRDIQKKFDLKREQIILVPGNHDLNWELSKKAYKLVDRNEYSDELNDGIYIEESESVIRLRDKEKYQRRFTYFLNFYQTITGQDYPCEYEQQGILYHFPQQNFLILGLNSSYEIDHYYTNRASIHPVALANALDSVRKSSRSYENCLKIAVWHHPLSSPFSDRITDQGFMQRLAQAGFQIALHGHMHKADTNLYRYDQNVGGRKLNVIGAGTFGAPMGQWTPGYPLQYNLLKWEGKRLIVETRKREEVNGTWQPDARWTQGSGKDPLPRYEIILPESINESNINSNEPTERIIATDTTIGQRELNYYIPIERRIRIQSCNKCNLDCPSCHWDEYERDIHPHYSQVLNLMENLKRDGQTTVIYPRPNISFTLTGGEPLLNKKYWIKFMKASSVYNEERDGQNINSAYLLTNGSHFDAHNIEVIKKEHLRKIRVSLNYDQNGEIVEGETRIGNIKSLLEKIDDVEIRFNHVIRTMNSINEINQFKDVVMKEFANWIPKNVKEIGYIQETDNEEIDIFTLAEQWCQLHGLPLQNDFLGTRKVATRLENGLMIVFIKLNCDVINDYIKRCFDCVQERDIGISADARVRICSGWNEDLKPTFKYAQVDLASPLVGISGAIRRQYGLAGFYGHFPFLINKLEDKAIPGFFQQNLFELGQFQKLLTKVGCPIDEPNLNTIIGKTAGIILKDNSPFKKLYEEGIYSQETLEDSTHFCEFLLRAAYDLAKNCTDIKAKNLLNSILLILVYFTVDESLFSTGRTVIVRGMTEDLIKELPKKKWNKLGKGFLITSTYCIATVAFEDIAPIYVDSFINFMLEEELQAESCEIMYLKGCIYRQLNKHNEAINAFVESYKESETKIKDKRAQTKKLYKEIRAESLRSLGAIKKNMPGKEDESRQHFLLSKFFGTLDDTYLRYTSFFSDGYSSFLRYFAHEHGMSTFAENGYRAYMYLKESTSLNNGFYASLIRLALLEVALDRLQDAKDHLLQAKKVFSRRGLLTDQEYLNSILCRLILLYTLYEIDKHDFDEDNFSQFLGLTIEDCKNVGRRDIECVREDAEILTKIIKTKYGNELEPNLWQISSFIEKFINGCDKLLQ